MTAVLIVALIVLVALLWLLRPSSANSEPSATDAPVPEAVVTSWPSPEGEQQPTGAASPAAPAVPPRPSPARTRRPSVRGTEVPPSPSPSPKRVAAAGIKPVVSGVASWYATGGPGVYGAAGPALRVGNWRGSLVTVCVVGGRCVALRLTDWCQCLGTRVIDLSLDAVHVLGLDPSLGLYRVTVTVAGH